MSSSPSNMEELITHRLRNTAAYEVHRPAASLWPLACQDKTGSHSPVLCPRRSSVGSISHRPAALYKRFATECRNIEFLRTRNAQMGA